MARGDGRKVVFQTNDDRLVFLKRLEETCGRCGWRVHAWVLMGNHFHLLLETPQPNLVAGMKWLLGEILQQTQIIRAFPCRRSFSLRVFSHGQTMDCTLEGF